MCGKLKNKISKILFIASIIIAIVFAIQLIGREFVMPFPAKLSIESPTGFCMDDEKPSAVIDSNNNKIIFLNKNKQVVSVENLTANSFISKAYSVARDDNYFYVLGEKFARNSNFAYSVRRKSSWGSV